MLIASIVVSVMHRYDVCLCVCPSWASHAATALAVAHVGSVCSQRLLSEPCELNKLLITVIMAIVSSAVSLLFRQQKELQACKELSDVMLAWLTVWTLVNDLHMVQLMPLLPRHLLLQ